MSSLLWPSVGSAVYHGLSCPGNKKLLLAEVRSMVNKHQSSYMMGELNRGTLLNIVRRERGIDKYRKGAILETKTKIQLDVLG